MFSDVESTATSESELVLRAQEQYLTTILERTETYTLETLERIRRAEAQAGPPPVHARYKSFSNLSESIPMRYCMTLPKVLCKPHYGNSHLEMGVWKKGAPH